MKKVIVAVSAACLMVFLGGCGFDNKACLKSVQDRYGKDSTYQINGTSHIAIDKEGNVRLVDTPSVTTSEIQRDVVIFTAKDYERIKNK
ncbi:MAG: hypothetical protein WCW65_02665 [Candidatus Paceibacterota bacterium]